MAREYAVYFARGGMLLLVGMFFTATAVLFFSIIFDEWQNFLYLSVFIGLCILIGKLVS